VRKEELIHGVGFSLQKLYALRIFELVFLSEEKKILSFEVGSNFWVGCLSQG